MKTCLVLLLACGAALPALRADHDDVDNRDFRSERGRDRGRVIIYADSNFRGDYLELYPGDTIDNFSGKSFENGSKLNDSISSIRIEGNVEVSMFENAGFRGQALRVADSVRDFSRRYVNGEAGPTWNDRISSLKVSGRRGGRDDDRDGDRDHGKGRPDGRPVAEIEKSITVVFRDGIGRGPDAGELRDFRRRFMEDGWNERMLRDHLRREDRYRNEYADLIVRRSYVEVLGREVDPGGLKTYRHKVLNEAWSEGDVRDDLRRSEEYRNKHK